jgi:putative endonuclease
MTRQTKQPAVYILASARNGTLYTGVTSDLVARVWQHKNDVVTGFSQKYATHTLVYYELLDDMLAAIEREKQIKAGSRAKKITLIESINPDWADLYESLPG